MTSVVPVANRMRVAVGAVTAEVTAESAERLQIREGDLLVASWKATATARGPLARLAKTTGVPAPGLRSHPSNLIRVMPAKGVR